MEFIHKTQQTEIKIESKLTQILSNNKIRISNLILIKLLISFLLIIFLFLILIIYQNILNAKEIKKTNLKFKSQNIISQYNSTENNKIALCVIVKNENKYINEFVNYYHKLGVTKIFIYDNNELDDDKYEENLKFELEKKIVEIINFRGKIKAQNQAYNDCYNKHSKKFDWFIISDCDEFYYFPEGNLNDFLDKALFKDCDSIMLNLVEMGDNNLTYYENKPVLERFKGAKMSKTVFIKSIHRGGHTNNKRVKLHPHISLNDEFKRKCNSNGKPSIYKGITSYIGYFKRGYIRHFLYKTAEELSEKLSRGWPDREKNSKSFKRLINDRINGFFNLNTLTKEKYKLLKPLIKGEDLKKKLENRLSSQK